MSTPIRIVSRFDGWEVAITIRPNERGGVDMRVGNYITPLTPPQALMLGKGLTEMAEPLIAAMPPVEEEEQPETENEDEDEDEDDSDEDEPEVIDINNE